ncbi:uncharacterized protein LOC134537238 [Bacillus rossius redtenbacheri]|uniref:uncharacterized protein LOC134537238 n=1 Tax=Bacillus rossius redtenbacheri TaxID=93214 RepID=UPI002FDE88A7
MKVSGLGNPLNKADWDQAAETAPDLAEVLRVVQQAWLTPRSCSLDRSVESPAGRPAGAAGAGLPHRRYSVPEAVMRRYALSQQRRASLSGSSGVATLPAGTPASLSAGSGGGRGAGDLSAPGPAAPGPPGGGVGGGGRSPGSSTPSPACDPSRPEPAPGPAAPWPPGGGGGGQSPGSSKPSSACDPSRPEPRSPGGGVGGGRRSPGSSTPSPAAAPDPGAAGRTEPPGGRAPAAEPGSPADSGTSFSLDQTASEHSLSTQDMTLSLPSESTLPGLSPAVGPRGDQTATDLPASVVLYYESAKEHDNTHVNTIATPEEEVKETERENVQNDVELKHGEMHSLAPPEALLETTGAEVSAPGETLASEANKNDIAKEFENFTFASKESQTTTEGISSVGEPFIQNTLLSSKTEGTASITQENPHKTPASCIETVNHKTIANIKTETTNIEIKNEISTSQGESKVLSNLETVKEHLINENVCQSEKVCHELEKWPQNPRNQNAAVDGEGSEEKSRNSSGGNESSVYRTSDTSIDMSMETPTECCITTPDTDQTQGMSDGLAESLTNTPLANTSDSNSIVSAQSKLRQGAESSTTLDQTVSDRSTSTQDTTASVETEATTPVNGSMYDIRHNDSTTLNQTVSDHSESTQDMTLSILSESVDCINQTESPANTTGVLMSTTLDQSVSDNSTSTQDMTLSIKSENSPLFQAQTIREDLSLDINSTKLGAAVIDRSVSTQDVGTNTVEDLGIDMESVDVKCTETFYNAIHLISPEMLSGKHITLQEIIPSENPEPSRRHTILSPVSENSNSRQSGEMTSRSNSSQDLEHIAFMDDKSTKQVKSNAQSIFYVVKPYNSYCSNLNDLSPQSNNDNPNLSVRTQQPSDVCSSFNKITSNEVGGVDGLNEKIESKTIKGTAFHSVLPSKPQAAEFCGTRYYPLQSLCNSSKSKYVESVSFNKVQTNSLSKMNNFVEISPTTTTEKHLDMYNGLPIRCESPSSVLSQTAYKWSHLTEKDKCIPTIQRESNWLQNRHQTSLEQETLSSCFGTGSCYRKTAQTELAVPRYSALPRTVSMLVNTSSGDCSSNSDSDSECLSLVDSLEDTTPSRRAKRSAETSNQRFMKEESAEILPEEGARRTPRRVQIATPRGLAKAFFVSISENETKDINIASKSHTVSDSMPDKLKDKLSQRHHQLAVKRIEKYNNTDPCKYSIDESRARARKYKMRRYLKKTKPITKDASMDRNKKIPLEKLKSDHIEKVTSLVELCTPKSPVKEDTIPEGNPEGHSEPKIYTPMFTDSKNNLGESIEKLGETAIEANTNNNSSVPGEEFNITTKSQKTDLNSSEVSNKVTGETEREENKGGIVNTAHEHQQHNSFPQTQRSENAQATQTNKLSANLQNEPFIFYEQDQKSNTLNNSVVKLEHGSYNKSDEQLSCDKSQLINENMVKGEMEVPESTKDTASEVLEKIPINNISRHIATIVSSVEQAPPLNIFQEAPPLDVDCAVPSFDTDSVTATCDASLPAPQPSPVYSSVPLPNSLPMQAVHEHDEETQNEKFGSRNSTGNSKINETDWAQTLNSIHVANKLQKSHIPVMKSPIALHTVSRGTQKTAAKDEVVAVESGSLSNLRASRPLQQPAASARRSANLLAGKFQQRFEVIPEEKSGSLESSTEDQAHRLVEKNNMTYIHSEKLPSKSVGINNGTGSNIPILVNGHQTNPLNRRNSSESIQLHKLQNKRYRNRFSVAQRRNGENNKLFKNAQSGFGSQNQYEKFKIGKENINEAAPDLKHGGKIDNINAKLIALHEKEQCTCSKGSGSGVVVDSAPDIVRADVRGEKLVPQGSRKLGNLVVAHLDRTVVSPEPDKLRECYRGRASVAPDSQDSELLSLSKGWINFYLLKGAQGTPDGSNTDDGGAATSDRDDRPRTVCVIGAGDERPRQRTVPPREPTVPALPRIPSREPSDSEASTEYLRPPATPRGPAARGDALDGSGELACSESSSSSCSNAPGGGGRGAVGLPPLRWPARPRRPARLARCRSRLQCHRGGGLPFPPDPRRGGDGWTVTVAGTTACPQPRHDVEMRLSFPACARRPPASQSDSGLGEDAHGDGTHPLLPPAHRWSVTVRNQADGFDGSEEMKAEKSLDRCLPDLTFNTGQLKQTKKIVKRPGTGQPAYSAVDEETARARARRRLSLSSWPKVHSVAPGKVAARTTSGNVPREARSVSLLADGDRGAATGGGLAVTGSAIAPGEKPRVPTMSERDLTRTHGGTACVAGHARA